VVQGAPLPAPFWQGCSLQGAGQLAPLLSLPLLSLPLLSLLLLLSQLLLSLLLAWYSKLRLRGGQPARRFLLLPCLPRLANSPCCCRQRQPWRQRRGAGPLPDAAAAPAAAAGLGPG
jgi:hypothetical protein